LAVEQVGASLSADGVRPAGAWPDLLGRRFTVKPPIEASGIAVPSTTAVAQTALDPRDGMLHACSGACERFERSGEAR
jgi:hypothetical protein